MIDRVAAATTALLTVFYGVAAAAPIPVSSLPLPPVAATERGEYRALDQRSGEELWRTRWALEATTSDPRVVRADEQGAGRRWTAERATWAIAMTVTLSKTEGHLSSTRKIRDASGTVIEVQQRDLDYRSGTGRMVTTRPGANHAETTTFPVTPDSIGVEMLPTELRVLPGAPGQAMQFDLVTREGKVYPMSATIVGQEHVTTPAGGFDCYKIELTLQGLRGLAAKLVLPPMYMWHTVAAPHFWVKYQGPDGGVGSKTVTMELVSFARTPAQP